MPHINLLYPFRPRSDFLTVLPDLAAACASVGPFGITLGEFRFFRHGSGRCTLWLVPEPAEDLRHLQGCLQAAFPDCDDLSRFSAGFTPHLSVGQCPSSREGERLREQLQAGWRPITFTLAEVALLARGETSPFVVEQWVPLARPVRDA